MSNKFVALLLVVCLVTVQGQHISVKYGEKVVPPEECFRYCFAASAYPGFLSQKVCKWRCSFVMWESVDGSSTRKHGPVGTTTGSLAPASHTHKHKE
ncbi:unnamed protein product [Vicia faba]|uniref:Uncharacterized protein n=1 Tax=Vicia faba TaxID=3906 RepID=A0AAV1A3Q0_VICFA|nr:unnamed protein product [Vicia faba]